MCLLISVFKHISINRFYRRRDLKIYNLKTRFTEYLSNKTVKFSSTIRNEEKYLVFFSDLINIQIPFERKYKKNSFFFLFFER